MEERAREATGERLGQLVAPLGREAVLAQRVVLLAELVALLVVGRQPQAARPPERVAAELAPSGRRSASVSRQYSAACSGPSHSRALSYAIAPPRSAKPPFRPLAPGRDLARLVQAHALARLARA